MRVNGSEIIIKILEAYNIDIIAGIPGGANLPLYNALYDSKINHILTRHEQGSTFLAQGIARSTGKVSVCFATSGPGATNTLTAIADAKLDSVPIVMITGQVPSSFIGTDAFQEVDTYGLTIPITKHNYFVHSAKDLLHILPEAFKIALSDRPGPVVIDVPKNVQSEVLDVDDSFFDNLRNNQANSTLNASVKESTLNKEEILIIDKMAELISKSERPMFYIGAGIINSNSSELLQAIAAKNSIPITSTLLGLGSIPSKNPLYIGMLGMHGAKYTNYAVNDSDLIIAMGVRFDDRATGDIDKFCNNAKIIHVDIDPAEINKLIKCTLSLSADLKLVLTALQNKIIPKARQEWLNKIADLKKQYTLKLPDKDNLLHPMNIIKKVSEIVPKDTIITTDVGQHQMWVAQVYPFSKPRTLLTSGGLGTMGFGLPAAIGAALANKDKKVVCFTGDGSLLMNIQELATLADLNLNLKIVLFKNGHLGLVRQQQELFYSKNYIASKFITNPDFVMIAKGFGIKAIDINLDNSSESATILKESLSDNLPILINIQTDHLENVLPMIPPGSAIYEMV